jgi:hypothetical protein
VIATVQILLGACIFAAGAYIGWRAAFARQEIDAPPLTEHFHGECVILDAAPERAVVSDEDEAIF